MGKNLELRKNNMVLVDSSIWIEAFRRQGDLLTSLALENLVEEGKAAYCGIIKLEVLGGARELERKILTNFFSLIPHIPQNEIHWDDTVRFQWICRGAGITIPWSDAVIATHAQKKGLQLYAKDKHFDSLEELGLLSLYRPGPGGAYVSSLAV